MLLQAGKAHATAAWMWLKAKLSAFSTAPLLRRGNSVPQEQGFGGGMESPDAVEQRMAKMNGPGSVLGHYWYKVRK